MKCLLLFISISITSSIFSQNTVASTTGCISGVVLDKDTNLPILFGTVTLYKDNVLILGTETDINGQYSFENLTYGKYRVEASYIGFEFSSITFALNKKQNLLDIYLKEGHTINCSNYVYFDSPLFELDNITTSKTYTRNSIRKLAH